MREKQISCLPYAPQPGIEPATQACILTVDQTHSIAVHRSTLQPREPHQPRFLYFSYSASYMGTQRAAPMGINYLVTENTWKCQAQHSTEFHGRIHLPAGLQPWPPRDWKAVNKDDYTSANISSCRLVIILEELKIKENHFKTWLLQTVCLCLILTRFMAAFWFHCPVRDFFFFTWLKPFYLRLGNERCPFKGEAFKNTCIKPWSVHLRN